MKEDKAGNRYPLANNMRAIIRKKDGLYYGFINRDELIAISSDVETVYERLKRVDRNIGIIIRYGNRNFKDIEAYQNVYLPRVYRITYSETKKHSLVIALDFFTKGDYSSVHLFYDFEKLINFVRRKQRNDGNYFIY